MTPIHQKNNVREQHTITLQPEYTVEIPDLSREVNQSDEWCTLTYKGQRQDIRFHEYDRIYVVPGLYECLFYDHLKCTSPQVVCDQLEKALTECGASIENLRVLDFGAGNGIVAEELRHRNVQTVVGADILSEAKNAALRDRSGMYDDYIVADFTQLSQEDTDSLRDYRFNCLIQVAGLGFGDIPVDAFATAWNLIETPGWVAFNIKKDFLDAGEPTGFSALIHTMIKDGSFQPLVRHKYRHRFSLAGTPLQYVVLAGRKKADISPGG